MSTTEIHGLCPDRFAGVKDAFAAHFVEAPEGLTERGARFSVCIEGRPVIDLWGGVADTAGTEPFTERSLVPVFSTGKAVMALVMALAVERGQLDYDTRVAALWPEFGVAGKAGVTVAQLLSHQAGLPGFADAVGPEIWVDPRAAASRLAAQPPMWPPGAASGYHPVTVGVLADETHRRATGRSIGQALRETFPDLDLWVGLPAAEHGRVAELRKPSGAADLGPIDDIKRAAFLSPGSAPIRGTAEWRMSEIPSQNMHGTALGLARIMGLVADGGRLDGRTLLSPATLEAATRERISGRDRVLPFDISWAAGLMRNRGLGVFGPGENSLGHYGWGGSCAFADPDRKLSAAYAMTRQSRHLIGDPRAMRLIEAVYAAL